MARLSKFSADTMGTPTLEVFQSLKSSITSVGTSATAIPATNLTGRKAIIVQNISSTASVYVGGAVVEQIGGKARTEPICGTIIGGMWWKSQTGNEWYFATTGKATTGMTQPTKLYYAAISAAPGTETAATSGTVGSLGGANYFGWGDGDSLGFSTLYMRTGGATSAYNPSEVYRVILGYSSLPDNSSSYGYKLGPMDSVGFTLDGSCRVFAAASATADVITLELA